MASNPTLITTPFAQSGDKTTPPNTNPPSDGRFSQTIGFPPITAIPLSSGGKAPKREDFNGAFNMLANILFYAQKGFTFNWDSTQNYYVGCRVIDSNDGNMYVCIADVAAGQKRPINNTTKWKKASMTGGGVPIGAIIEWAVNGSLPDGFLECDGSDVSRTTYSDLYSAIGVVYGSGDGSTTFNIPNFVDKVPQGSATAGTVKSAGLPNIEGYTNGGGGWKSTISTSGSFYVDDLSGQTHLSAETAGTNYKHLVIDASRSSSVYGNSNTVQPPALTTRFIIRYE